MPGQMRTERDQHGQAETQVNVSQEAVRCATCCRAAECLGHEWVALTPEGKSSLATTRSAGFEGLAS